MTDPTNNNQNPEQIQQPQNLSNGLGHIYAGAITAVLAVAYYHSNIQPLDFQPLAPIQPILHAAAAMFGRGSLEALVCGAAEIIGVGMLVRGFSDRTDYKRTHPNQPQYQQLTPAVVSSQIPLSIPQQVVIRIPCYTCLDSGNLATTICPKPVERYYDSCNIPGKCTLHRKVGL